MNRKRYFTLFILVVLALVPMRVFAASELALEVEFESPVMKKEGAQRYGWTLTNDSPNDVQSICLSVDGAVIQELGRLKSGETVSGWGIMDIADEDFERYICFIANGYTEITNTNSDISQKKITRYVESSCNAVACKAGTGKQMQIPEAPELKLPEEAEEADFQLDACAFVESSAVQAGADNELLVFIKNNGNTDASQLAVLLKKEVMAESETLTAGRSLVLRCHVKAENGKSIQPSLRYVNGKGKTVSQKLEKIEFYQEDQALQLSLSADDDDPTPRTETGLYIDIRNTGEKTISGIKLFDYQGNPVNAPASKLKAGETMRVYTQVQLQRETDVAYYARYNNKKTVVSASEPLHIKPAIPEGTAQMTLRVSSDKTELHGEGRDMATFTCTLANSGSYTLSGVLLKNGAQVIGSCAVLPPGEAVVFKTAYCLDGAGELLFTAIAADETGEVRECSAVASLRAGNDFIKQN